MGVKRLPFLAANLAGLAAFATPFLINLELVPSAAQARAGDAPWLTAILVPLLIAVALAETAGGRLDAKAIALLGVLSACAALLRLPVSLAGANLFFFLPIVAGYVFGGTFGFLLGSLSMAASAVITGGIGPWLPFQMWAAGWVGGAAGLLRPLGERLRRGLPRLVPPAIYAYAAAFFYGALMNLYFWPVVATGDAAIGWMPGLGLAETVRHYRAFYLLTSAGWDAVGAVFNAIVVLALGGPAIDLLHRYRNRFAFVAAPFSVPSVEDCVMRATPAVRRLTPPK